MRQCERGSGVFVALAVGPTCDETCGQRSCRFIGEQKARSKQRQSDGQSDRQSDGATRVGTGQAGDRRGAGHPGANRRQTLAKCDERWVYPTGRQSTRCVRWRENEPSRLCRPRRCRSRSPNRNPSNSLPKASICSASRIIAAPRSCSTKRMGSAKEKALATPCELLAFEGGYHLATALESGHRLTGKR